MIWYETYNAGITKKLTSLAEAKNKNAVAKAVKNGVFCSLP